MTPLDLVASMVLDSGARWGEEAVPEQWADMEALLSPGGPRRHFWLRARGRSKSFDAGAASLAMMLGGVIGPGDEAYAAAAGRDQAGLLVRKVRAIAERTPELAGAVEIQNYRVITPRTGAVLDCMSSDLASSWGRPPRWLFVDEIANHERGEGAQTFIEAMLTSLPKRPDSQCLAATTPSSPSHWSHALWQSALADPLWRCSLTAGPAPWQEAAELESERRRLPDSLWRRLFLCEWAEADDALADAAAVQDCVRHDGALAPQRRVSYIVSFDLSVSGDHTAVVVAHLADEDGRRTVVVDRLEAWVPRGGRQVDLADVEAWISQAARDYNSATVAGDPYQAVSMIQRLREAGLHVKPVTFSAGANSKRAQMLLRLVRDRCLDLPDDRALRTELLSLRLAEGATPGTLKLTADTGTGGHHDRVTALMIAAEHLLGQTGGSWLGAYGLRACGQCGEAYRLERDTCLHCGADNPDAGEEPAGEAAGEGTTAAAVPQPATVSAWGVAKCENGHPYFVDRNGGKCPTCHRGTGLPRGGLLAGLAVGGFR